jgi:hypothetical protein
MSHKEVLIKGEDSLKINTLSLIPFLITISLTMASESQQDRDRRIRQEQAIRDTQNRAWMAHAQMTGQQISPSAQMQMNPMDRAAAWLQNQNTGNKK